MQESDVRATTDAIAGDQPGGSCPMTRAAPQQLASEERQPTSGSVLVRPRPAHSTPGDPSQQANAQTV
eukprot:6492443-Amphidinium_carterae.3